MAHMVLDCPHCASTKIGFDVIASSPATGEGQPNRRWNVFLHCRHCNRGVVVELYAVAVASTTSPAQFSGDPRDQGYAEGEMFPRPQKAVAPEHVTEAIARDYEEAVDNLGRGNYTSAGMMFRKVLQRSTTALTRDAASMKSKRLEERIEILETNGLITSAMRDWATIIRLEGNAATHWEEEYGEAEFTKESATQLHHFTELFLIYTFTLPAQVARYAQVGEE